MWPSIKPASNSGVSALRENRTPGPFGGRAGDCSLYRPEPTDLPAFSLYLALWLLA
jgi:hypothetical protein